MFYILALVNATMLYFFQTQVIAYVMKSYGKTLKESMELVKNCRSIVNPNAGFEKQLIIYEGILNSR